MIYEINEHVLQLNNIVYISKAYGSEGHRYFKFLIGTKEFEWDAEYRNELREAWEKSQAKPIYKYSDVVLP